MIQNRGLTEIVTLLYNTVIVRYIRQMTVTTNDRGQQNMWAKEPVMYYSKEDMARYGLETHAERAEKMNGRWAMIGVIAAMGSYALTGDLIPGIW